MMGAKRKGRAERPKMATARPVVVLKRVLGDKILISEAERSFPCIDSIEISAFSKTDAGPLPRTKANKYNEFSSVEAKRAGDVMQKQDRASRGFPFCRPLSGDWLRLCLFPQDRWLPNRLDAALRQAGIRQTHC